MIEQPVAWLPVMIYAADGELSLSVLGYTSYFVLLISAFVFCRSFGAFLALVAAVGAFIASLVQFSVFFRYLLNPMTQPEGSAAHLIGWMIASVVALMVFTRSIGIRNG